MGEQRGRTSAKASEWFRGRREHGQQAAPQLLLVATLQPNPVPAAVDENMLLVVSLGNDLRTRRRSVRDVADGNALGPGRTQAGPELVVALLPEPQQPVEGQQDGRARQRSISGRESVLI